MLSGTRWEVRQYREGVLDAWKGGQLSSRPVGWRNNTMMWGFKYEKGIDLNLLPLRWSFEFNKGFP